MERHPFQSSSDCGPSASGSDFGELSGVHISRLDPWQTWNTQNQGRQTHIHSNPTRSGQAIPPDSVAHGEKVPRVSDGATIPTTFFRVTPKSGSDNPDRNNEILGTYTICWGTRPAEALATQAVRVRPTLPKCPETKGCPTRLAMIADPLTSYFTSRSSICEAISFSCSLLNPTPAQTIRPC